MSSVLFIHSAGPQGAGEGSHRLVAALREALGKTVRFEAPLMPEPDAPDAAAWGMAFASHLAGLRAPFVLVGHSLGGSTILKYLAEEHVPEGLAGVILIAAPFWGAPDWEVPDFALPDGFAMQLSGLPRLVLYHSLDDDGVPVSHVDLYASALPNAEVRKVDGRGHAFDTGEVADIVEDVMLSFEPLVGDQRSHHA